MLLDELKVGEVVSMYERVGGCQLVLMGTGRALGREASTVSMDTVQCLKKYTVLCYYQSLGNYGFMNILTKSSGSDRTASTMLRMPETFLSVFLQSQVWTV